MLNSYKEHGKWTHYYHIDIQDIRDNYGNEFDQ